MTQTQGQLDYFCILSEVNLRYRPLNLSIRRPSANLVSNGGKFRRRGGVVALTNQPVVSAHVFRLSLCGLGQKAVALLIRGQAPHSHPVFQIDGIILSQLGIVYLSYNRSVDCIGGKLLPNTRGANTQNVLSNAQVGHTYKVLCVWLNRPRSACKRTAARRYPSTTCLEKTRRARECSAACAKVPQLFP